MRTRRTVRIARAPHDCYCRGIGCYGSGQIAAGELYQEATCFYNAEYGEPGAVETHRWCRTCVDLLRPGTAVWPDAGTVSPGRRTEAMA